MSQVTTPNPPKDMDISVSYIKGNYMCKEGTRIRVKVRLLLIRIASPASTASTFKSKGPHKSMIRSIRRMPKSVRGSGKSFRRGLPLQLRLNSRYSHTKHIAYFRIKNDCTCLAVQHSKERLQTISSDLILIVSNGQNHNKKGLYLRPAKMLHYHCIQKIKKIT